MTQAKGISRRAALARLGLAVGGAYLAPAMVGLSAARAASNPSPPSAPSEPTAPTPPSPPSPVTAPTAPTAATAPSVVTAPSVPETASTSQAVEISGPSGPGACRTSTISPNGTISHRDYERAQRAISRGEARPLRDVVSVVQSRHPGRLLQVGFSESGSGSSFRVLIVDQRGAVVSVTVDAGSAQITNVQRC